MSTEVAVPETAKPIGPVTVDDVRRTFKGVVKVCSGSDFTETLEMGGQFFVFPPRGVCEIQDILDYPWAKSSTGKRARVWDRKEIIWAAPDLAFAMCSDEHYGKKGFVLLLNDGHDEERKLSARRRWVAWYEDYCRQIESRWVSRVTAFRAANPGGIPPRQPRTVQHCQAWLDKLEAGNVDVGDRPAGAAQPGAVCGYCSAEFATTEAAKDHVKLRHPAGVDDPEAVVIPGKAEKVLRKTLGVPMPPLPEEPGHGRPEASEVDGATAYLLRKAKTLGVPIEPKELEGMILGDEDTISIVTRKIAEAAAGEKAEHSDKRRIGRAGKAKGGK